MRLYHYTDAAGLLGMLGRPGLSPEIWLSQIQYMNDSKEWWHAYELFRMAVYRLRSHSHPLVNKLAENAWAHCGPPSVHTPVWGGFQRTFVFSLSEKKDLLSQWRAYAPDGGYSIGFCRQALEELAGFNGFSLVKCLYDDSEKDELMDRMVQSVVSDVMSHVVSEQVRALGLDEDQAVIATGWTRLQREVGDFARYFKHQTFYEEQEWRLVGQVPAGGTDPRERWRTRGSIILPYCALNVSSPELGFPIESVTVGPGVDFMLAQHSIEFLYFGRGSLEIDRSLATLRR